MTHKKGFTLIELLIVMIIIGILAAMITGTFFSSIKKGNDARRKSDLGEIQKALENYYEDQKAYPTSLPSSGAFSNSGKVYMERISTDPNNNNRYYYVSDGTQYKIYSCIDNNQDAGPGVNQSGYTGTDCGGCGTCKYGLSSPNTTP